MTKYEEKDSWLKVNFEFTSVVTSVEITAPDYAFYNAAPFDVMIDNQLCGRV